MRKRACLFCGGTPLTKEDVIAEWIAKHLGVTRLTRKDSIRGLTLETVDSFDIKSGWFCEECNNVWMNTMETAVQPWMKPLLLGRRTEMSQEGQAALSSWAWKTTLTASSTAIAGRDGFDMNEFRRFRATGVPPTDAYVWMGFFAGGDSQGNLFRLESKWQFGSGGEVVVDSWTLTVGAVWFQTFRPRSSQFAITPDPSPWCVQIWPTSAEAVVAATGAVSKALLQKLVERWQTGRFYRM